MRLPSRIYHMTEAPNWPSIRQAGLLPARELLTRAWIAGSGGNTPRFPTAFRPGTSARCPRER